METGQVTAVPLSHNMEGESSHGNDISGVTSIEAKSATLHKSSSKQAWPQLPAQLEKVPSAVEFPKQLYRWSTGEEVASILNAFSKHKEWLSDELAIRPSSGAMFLYNSKKVKYRKDGYCWLKKKKDGKRTTTSREDHLTLKIQGVGAIRGYYVHSAILPSFHRRSYFLQEKKDIVLVHYLNEPNDKQKDIWPSLSEVSDKRKWTTEDIMEQLEPMFASLNGAEIPDKERLNKEMLERIAEQMLQEDQERTKKPTSRCTDECMCKLMKSSSCKESCSTSKCRRISPKADNNGEATEAQNRLSHLLQQQSRSLHHQRSNSTPNAGSVLFSPGTVLNQTHIRQMGPSGAPIFLQLAQLQGSSGYVLISSQNPTATSGSTAVATAEKDDKSEAAKDTLKEEQAGEVDDEQDEEEDKVKMEGVEEQAKIPEKREEEAEKEFEGEAKDGVELASISSQTQQHTTDILSQAAAALLIDTRNGLHQDGGQDNLEALVNEFNKEDGRIGDLQLTADEIHRTLNANLPSDLPVNEVELPTNTSSIQQSIVSPESTDLNLFDIDTLDLNELEQGDNVNTTQAMEAKTSSPNHSTASPVAEMTSSTDGKCAAESQHGGPPRACATITDFSPEWAYVEGGVKVLVTGPWYSTQSPYTVLFDGFSVAATLVQSGVLRCFCPAHTAGLVTLQVACEGFVVSNSCVFEYRQHMQTEGEAQKTWFKIPDDHLKFALLEKLERTERHLGPANESESSNDSNFVTTIVKQLGWSSDPFENRLIRLTCSLSRRGWLPDVFTPSTSFGGLTMLHLAAALGYARLLQLFIAWRVQAPSSYLEKEVDAMIVDENSCTPLMWACARGCQEVADVLCHWNNAALNVADKDGTLPLTMAGRFGHFHIVSHLEKLELNMITSACGVRPPEHRFAVPSPPRRAAKAKTKGAVRKPHTAACSQPASLSYGDFLRVDIPHPSHLSSSQLQFHNPPATQHVEPARSSDFAHLRTPGDAQEDAYAQNAAARGRLQKRLSVEVLPDYPHGGFLEAYGNAGLAASQISENPRPGESHSEIRMSGLMTDRRNPMFCSVRNPPTSRGNLHPSRFHGLSLDEIQQGMVAMETEEGTNRSPIIDIGEAEDEDFNESPFDSQEDTADVQMERLANQIVAAMPARIKLSPGRGDDMPPDDQFLGRRERSSSRSSFSSFSSYSSLATPGATEDSGISTPLEPFDEYRSLDLGTPASSLSPVSSMHSPYTFDMDSPPPTAEEFSEYFNAPQFFLEKDFSQLTLSDWEQRHLYDAARVIQSFYRRFKDRREREQSQRQREVHAAILIQSCYRRYKQYAYYKKMTQAAVLIQSQFRTYYAQKLFRKSRKAATVIQTQYRTYKQQERFKKSRNAAVIIQQRFRSHYQRKKNQAETQRKIAEEIAKNSLEEDIQEPALCTSSQPMTSSVSEFGHSELGQPGQGDDSNSVGSQDTDDTTVEDGCYHDNSSPKNKQLEDSL